MTQKKLIIFMPSIEGGGVEKNLFIIANFLAQKINGLFLITASYNFKKRFNHRIKIILPKHKIWENFGRKYKYLICLLILFKFLIVNKNTTVLAFQANLYCIILCKLLSVKIIVRSNSAPEGWSNNLIKKYLYKLLINQADKVIVNSYDFKKNMKKKFNVNSTVIYNPLNKSEIIKKSKKIQNKVFPKNCLKIINIGRFVDQKDQLTLLRSLNLIKNKINFFAIIMGRGILHKKLLSYVNQNNLSDNVKFINYKENPYPYIKQAEIFILSSKYEGLPNVLLEAITLKKFVISTNCPVGPREILMNGKAGSLFPVGNFRKLAYKILSYQTNKINKKKIVKKAYKNLYRFDFKKNLNKYLNLIITLM